MSDASMEAGKADGAQNPAQNLEAVRQRFAADRFAVEAAGITVEEASPRHAVCSMEIRPVHRNAAGAVMGGAVFTLADFCFAVAANNADTAGATVSLSSSVTFLSPAKGRRLTAEAVCVKSGRTTCLYTVNVRDELDTKVAFVSTTGFRTAAVF